MKYCSRCNQSLAEDQFYRNKRSKDGLRAQCKMCFNTYYKRNRESMTEDEYVLWRKAHNESHRRYRIKNLITLCCIVCGNDYEGLTGGKYCSIGCQQNSRYEKYIADWHKGYVAGSKGKDQVSSHIRRYLFEKYGNQCSDCGWSELHSVTGRVPLQVDHIDGDYTNNREDNLRLLCPNCHSLTPTFGALNIGNGPGRSVYSRR